MRHCRVVCKLILRVYSGRVRPFLAVPALLVVLSPTLGSPAGSRAQAAGSRSSLETQMTDSITTDVAAIVKAFRGQMGVAAIDLRSGATVAVDADLRFPTASTIKTAVMVEAWQQAADGHLTMDTAIPLDARHKVGGAGVLRHLHDGLPLTIADLVHLMIVVSDNTATNMLIERLGTARINAGLERYGLREIRLFRPTFRDGRADVLPDLEREYGLGMTTPRDMARLMALIAEGKAVNRTASEAMLATLRRQQDRALIPRHISGDGVEIGNKTGTDAEKQPGADGRARHVRGDAAIVTGPNHTYVIAIHARQIEDTRWGIDNDALVTGARVAKRIHDGFAAK
jgi:beta-lactamase class A